MKVVKIATILALSSIYSFGNDSTIAKKNYFISKLEEQRNHLNSSLLASCMLYAEINDREICLEDTSEKFQIIQNTIDSHIKNLESDFRAGQDGGGGRENSGQDGTGSKIELGGTDGGSGSALSVHVAQDGGSSRVTSMDI